MQHSSSPLKHGPPAGASANLRKEDDPEMEFGGDSASQINSNPQLTKENLNKLPNMQQSHQFLRPIDSISQANMSQARTIIQNSLSRKIVDQSKVRNFCPNHKLVYVNKCL
jgi:cob(I)alamin adenosyltransferase